MLKCYLCGRECKTYGGIALHFRNFHKDVLDSLGYPAIKAKTTGTPEKIDFGPKESRGIKPSQTSEPIAVEKPTAGLPKDEPKADISPDEITGNEPVRPQNVELLWDDNKPFEMKAGRALPKAMRLDSRVDILFSYLKNKGKIPERWTISDFINAYVLEHVSTKDNVNLSVTQDIQGTTDKRVVMMENEFGIKKKEKSPEDAIKDLQSQEITDLQIEKFKQKIAGKEGEKKGMRSDFLERTERIMEKVNEAKAEQMIMKSMFGEDDGQGKNKEMEGLKDEIKKLQEDKKMEGLRGAIDNLKDSLKDRKPSSEIGAKDLIPLITQTSKQQSDYKDQLHHKDMELMRQSQESNTEMLAGEMKRMREKPGVVSQMKEITEVKKAFEDTGMLKTSEKSNTEIASNLISGVADKVIAAPGFQGFMSNLGKQDTPYTPEQQAQIAALEKKQQGQANPQQEIPKSVVSPNEEQEKMYDNLINVSDSDDKRERRARQGQ